MFIGLHAGGNIASVAVTTQLYVPFSAILAAIFLNDRASTVTTLAILIAVAGVFVIGFDPVVFNHLDALLWVIGAAFAMAVATILMKKCPDLGVFRLQAWVAVIACPSLFFLSLIFETDQLHSLVNSHIIDFWTPLYSAVGASIIGHGIVYFLIGRYPVSLVTPLLLLAPILASIFGVILFNDVLGWKLILGGIMTLLGVLVIATYPEVQKRKKMLK